MLTACRLYITCILLPPRFVKTAAMVRKHFAPFAKKLCALCGYPSAPPRFVAHETEQFQLYYAPAFEQSRHGQEPLCALCG